MAQAEKFPLHPRTLQSALRWATALLQANVAPLSTAPGSSRAGSAGLDAAGLLGSRLGMVLEMEACWQALQYSSEEWPGSFPQFVLGFVAGVDGSNPLSSEVCLSVASEVHACGYRNDGRRVWTMVGLTENLTCHAPMPHSAQGGTAAPHLAANQAKQPGWCAA